MGGGLEISPKSRKNVREASGILAKKWQKRVLKVGKMCYALVDRQGKGDGMESRKGGLGWLRGRGGCGRLEGKEDWR